MPIPSHFAPLPTHTMRLEGPLDWPVPSFASRTAWDEDEAITPVRIETLRGYAVDGEMLGFDLARQSLIFRFDAEGRPLRVHFHRFRRLTLLQPLAATPVGTLAKATFASHLRKFRIALTGNGKLLGRTAGHVETRDGLFLFTPDDDERTLQRTFVPSMVYTRCVLGPSVEEEAALRWATSPETLMAAIEETQQRRRAFAIGEAIYNLGVISARQLTVALTAQGSASRRQPVGEMLVADGLLSRADLRTALGHKMGYPLVHLGCFPLDPTALHKLPLDIAFEWNALPLLLRPQQIVVAVDNLARVSQLAALPELQALKVVPALARQAHIEAALLRAYQTYGGEGWNESRSTTWKSTSPMAA